METLLAGLRKHPRTPGSEDAPARPGWAVPVRLLERTTLVVLTLALGTGLVTEPDPPPVAVLAYLVAAAAVVLARRRPVAGLLLVAAAPVLVALTGREPLALWNVTVFSAFLLTLRGAPAVLTAVVAAVGAATAQWVYQPLLSGDQALTPAIAAFSAVAAAATGNAVRAHDRYRRALEQRTRDAETGREMVLRRGIAEERLRIARDLHDSVGHAVAVVSVRLGSAQVQLPAGAETARGELAAAQQGVRDVLQEMQQILRVLRVAEDVPDDLAPTPDAAHLPDLLARVRSAGLDVRARLGDLPDPLPAHVGTALYRIVQEALTNALEHGGGTADLHVEAVGGTVRLRVENPVANPARRGGGPRRPSGGHGLVGMRERAVATGGTFGTTTREGRFTVTAELPVGAGAR